MENRSKVERRKPTDISHAGAQPWIGEVITPASSAQVCENTDQSSNGVSTPVAPQAAKLLPRQAEDRDQELIDR